MSTRNNRVNNQKNGSRNQNVSILPATNSLAYLTSSSFIVIIVLLFVIGAGIYFYREYKAISEATKKKLLKETEPNSCPDYWEIVDKSVDETGKVKSLKCKNVMHIGKVALNPGDDTFTFDDEIFTNPNTRNIARCQWAKQNGVAWSGYERFC